MDEQMTRLAKMVRLWIAAAGIEQLQLAEAWGAQPSTVSRFLSGQGMPDGRTMARIIAWLLEPGEGSCVPTPNDGRPRESRTGELLCQNVATPLAPRPGCHCYACDEMRRADPTSEKSR